MWASGGPSEPSLEPDLRGAGGRWQCLEDAVLPSSLSSLNTVCQAHMGHWGGHCPSEQELKPEGPRGDRVPKGVLRALWPLIH